MFWLIFSSLVFALSSYAFFRVMLRPNDSTKHLFALSAAYLALMISGCIFAAVVVIQFFGNDIAN